MEKDKKLALGITRKYLFKVFNDLGCFKDEEDIKGFFRHSGYGK